MKKFSSVANPGSFGIEQLFLTRGLAMRFSRALFSGQAEADNGWADDQGRAESFFGCLDGSIDFFHIVAVL